VGLALVDNAAVGDFNHQHRQLFLFDVAEHPAVSDAIAPQARKFVEQGLAEIPRIRSARDALMKVKEDATLNRLVNLAKSRSAASLNSICQAILPANLLEADAGAGILQAFGSNCNVFDLFETREDGFAEKCG